MKKIYFIVVAFFCFANGFAQTTWNGNGTTNNWNDAGNWSTGVVPTNGTVDVIFDGTSTKNCTFNVGIDVKSLSINTNYTGIITGGTNNHLVRGLFSINDGTFNSTTGVLRIIGSPSLGGSGTFNHNSGIVTLLVDDIVTTTITGPFVFNQLRLQDNGLGSAQRNVDFGSCTTNTLNLDALAAGAVWGYQGAVDVRAVLNILGTNTGAPVSNTAVFTFSGAGPISITGAGSAGMNILPNIVMNTSGNITMSGHVSLEGNWSATSGTLVSGSSTTNFYGAAAAVTGAAAFDNLTIQTGASVTFPSTEVLVGRNFTNNGTVSFPATSVLGLNGGNTNQTISGTGFTAGSIRAHSAGTGRSITLSTQVTITDSLKLEDNVTFASGGNLTLNSDNVLTARLAQLGTGAFVTGNVTVETFIPGGTTGWANLGVRGVMNQQILSWDTYSTSSGANGIPMTCQGCSYGVLDLGFYFESIQAWDEGAAAGAGDYDTLLTASSSLSPGKGFWTYVGTGFSTTNGITTINTGSLVQGSVPVGVASTGSVSGNLIANPYPCPISWTTVVSEPSNQVVLGNDAIYVWNADIGASGAMTSFIAGVPSHANGISDIIPAGQGFYIEGVTTSANLNFNENMKVNANTGAGDPILKPAASNAGQIFRLKMAGLNNEWDQTTFRIHNNATPAYDSKFDAHKISVSPGYAGYPGAYSKYTSISSLDPFNEEYSIHSLPPLTQSVSVPIRARVATTGPYTISATDFQDFNVCLTLYDRVTNTYHDLMTSAYICNINDTTSAPRFDLILCKDLTLNPVSVAEINQSQFMMIGQDAQGPLVKTFFQQNTKATISAYNIIGQKIMADIKIEGTATLTHLNLDCHDQVVLIRVTTDKESIAKKMVTH